MFKSDYIPFRLGEMEVSLLWRGPLIKPLPLLGGGVLEGAMGRQHSRGAFTIQTGGLSMTALRGSVPYNMAPTSYGKVPGIHALI